MQTEKHMDRQTCRQTDTQIHREMHRMIGRQRADGTTILVDPIDRGMDRRTDGITDEGGRELAEWRTEKRGMMD